MDDWKKLYCTPTITKKIGTWIPTNYHVNLDCYVVILNAQLKTEILLNMVNMQQVQIAIVFLGWHLNH